VQLDIEIDGNWLIPFFHLPPTNEV